MYPRIELSSLEGGSSNRGDPEPFASADIAADGNFFSSITRDTTFYIVRHGQSEGNATFTFQGRLDYPLDARGLEQAKAAAAWLAEKKRRCRGFQPSEARLRYRFPYRESLRLRRASPFAFPGRSGRGDIFRH